MLECVFVPVLMLGSMCMHRTELVRVCSQCLAKATNWVWMWVLKLVMDWGEKSLTAAGRQAVAHTTYTIL